MWRSCLRLRDRGRRLLTRPVGPGPALGSPARAYAPPTGLQVLLPDYLQECFVQAALSYIACNSEGEFICKDNDCWCQCGPRFPECNCPSMDIQAVEENLLRVSETWEVYNSNFEESVSLKYPCILSCTHSSFLTM
nr:BMP/retinoic acid-inducible neural-specific protein 3 isoform X3 [Oryctolagus cuniculus]